MTEYDHILEADENGTFTMPEKYHGEDCVVRKPNGTTTHQGDTMRWEASSQNKHLEVNKEEGWMEAEAKVFGEDETELIKVELPEGYFKEKCGYCGKEAYPERMNDVRFDEEFEDKDYVCHKCNNRSNGEVNE